MNDQAVLAPLLPGLIAELHGHTLHAEICRAVLKSDPCSSEPPHPELNFNHQDAGTVLHWACGLRLTEAALAILDCWLFIAVNAKLKADRSSALHIACAEGLTPVVEALLAHPQFTAAPDQDSDGFTALHAAAFRGHTECARLLLTSPRYGTAAGVIGMFDVARPKDHWASEAAAIYDMRTALHMAASKGHAEICEAILTLSPYHCAADVTNRIGATALHMAAREKHIAACLAILRRSEFNAVNARDARGFTALHWAAHQASGDICQAVLGRDDFTAVADCDLKGRTAMDIAKEFGYHEVRRLILARMGADGLGMV
jgi:ankyrin repeat protein